MYLLMCLKATAYVANSVALIRCCNQGALSWIALFALDYVLVPEVNTVYLYCDTVQAVIILLSYESPMPNLILVFAGACLLFDEAYLSFFFFFHFIVICKEDYYNPSVLNFSV